MRPRLPPLAALRAFDQVGRCRSLRAAAHELDLSHTVVRQHMRELEAWFGRELLQRSPRGVTLSDDGLRLHQRVSQAFALIDQAVTELAAPAGSKTLTIWCPPGLAAHWITPRFMSLQQALPHVAITLRPSEAAPALANHAADVEIRYGVREEPGIFTEILFYPPMLALASPAWAAQHPEACHLENLVRLPLIHESDHDQWQQWLAANGVALSARLEGPRFWNAIGTREAACQGLGVALLPEPLATSDLASGQLVKVTPHCPALEPYSLSIISHRAEEVTIRRFRQWIKEQCG